MTLKIKFIFIFILINLANSSENDGSETYVAENDEPIISDENNINHVNPHNNQDENNAQDPDSQPTFADIPESLYDSFRDRDTENESLGLAHQIPSVNISSVMVPGNNTSTMLDGLLGLKLNSTNETLATNTSTKPPKVLIACTPYIPKEYRILLPVELDSSTESGNSSTENNETNSSNSSDESQPQIQMKETILNYTPTVEIVNVTKLQQEVLWSNSSIRNKSTPANCSIVLFYASWCRYSANAASHYNALPRAFPSLRVVAIDSYKYKSVTSYYGILAVPTILLFHNGKAVAKFNGTSFTLNRYAEFIESFAELKSIETVNVTSQDFMGPLPTNITEEVDVWLILAWVFIILCFFYYISNSTLWKKIVDLILSTWREAEDQQLQPQQHEHLD